MRMWPLPQDALDDGRDAQGYTPMLDCPPQSAAAISSRPEETMPRVGQQQQPPEQKQPEQQQRQPDQLQLPSVRDELQQKLQQHFRQQLQQ